MGISNISFRDISRNTDQVGKRGFYPKQHIERDCISNSVAYIRAKQRE